MESKTFTSFPEALAYARECAKVCGDSVPVTAVGASWNVAPPLAKEPGKADIWAARWEKTIVVFDPSAQMAGSRFIFLWNVESREMDKYVADAVLEHLDKTLPTREATAALSDYGAWFSTNGAAWIRHLANERQAQLDEQAQAQEKKQKKQKGIEAEHRRLIERAGVAYPGPPTRETRKERERQARCWYCQDPLNSLSDLKCAGCGWILCECGACGCAYQRIANAKGVRA